MFGIIFIFNLLCLNSNMCDVPFENHPRVMREACFSYLYLLILGFHAAPTCRTTSIAIDPAVLESGAALER